MTLRVPDEGDSRMASCALMYLVFQSFDFERTWWRWFQNGVVRTNVFGFQIFRLCAYLMKVIPVMGQKSSRTNKFPYIFHIKPWLILILIKLFLTRFHEILSIKAEIDIVPSWHTWIIGFVIRVTKRVPHRICYSSGEP